MTSALVRYIVNGPAGGYYWWSQLAAPFLEDRGWLKAEGGESSVLLPRRIPPVPIKRGLATEALFV